MKPLVVLQSKIILLAVFLVFFVCGIGICQAVDYNTVSKIELQDKIASFGLGFDSYVVGKKLTAAQLATAEKDNAYKAYPGTVKFKDGDLFVIVDKKTNVVIAVYKRNRKAGKNDVKTMISDLMMQYGEPTAEAHGKTIYWNYGADGLIPEELYRTVKSQGQLETLIVLATVKFSSSENIETMSDMIETMNKKKEGKEIKKADVTSDNYVMIQSDLLTKKYMEK
jgi:hypothetical protein